MSFKPTHDSICHLDVHMAPLEVFLYLKEAFLFSSTVGQKKFKKMEKEKKGKRIKSQVKTSFEAPDIGSLI